MSLPSPTIIFGLYVSADEARSAIEELQRAGFNPDQFELTEPGDLADESSDPKDRGSGLLSALARFRHYPESEDESLFDRLSDLGATEAEALHYEEQVRAGKALVSVVSMHRGADAASILARHGSAVTVAAGAESATQRTDPVMVREGVSVAAGRMAETPEIPA